MGSITDVLLLELASCQRGWALIGMSVGVLQLECLPSGKFIECLTRRVVPGLAEPAKPA